MPPSLRLQASFDPPGLTVAVKRDRAVEALLPVGNRFVLTVLAEGKERAAVKQLMRPFGPAEDRFAGLEVQRSELSGAAILPAAAASYLECRVEQRMEAGDHFLVYAVVEEGKVLCEAPSAVHHRKIGSTY